MDSTSIQSSTQLFSAIEEAFSPYKYSNKTSIINIDGIIQGGSVDKISLSDSGTQLSRKISADESVRTDSQTTEAQSKDQTQTLKIEETLELQKLQKRDAEVKAHEMAHLAIAGHYAAGGASFSFTTGPDGKRYAVGGEVPIDMSKEPTPEETIAKMQIIKRAALAPATPSSADRQIAAQASVTESHARSERQNASSEKIAVSFTNTSDEEETRTTDTQADSNTSRTIQRLATVQHPAFSANSRHLIVKAYTAQSG